MLVCFDYEGRWGMPFAAPYDLDASTHRILEVLAQHETQAVFFVVGAIAVAHPELVRAISSHGHEIALHGWRHERLDRLGPEQLARFADGLEESGSAIEAATGQRPVGFRAPYLLGPAFFDASVYGLLASRGYRWISNRELRQPIELLRPDRIRTERPWRFVESRPRLIDSSAAQALLVALNWSLFRGDTAGRPPGSVASWLRTGCKPFYRGGLFEIPLYSPMDCDLLGLPRPSCPTPEPLLDYARFALESCLSRSGPLAMLTFHDWIISGANRVALLDSMLSFMRAAGLRARLVEDHWTKLNALADMNDVKAKDE